jgi:hypothetical protein
MTTILQPRLASAEIRYLAETMRQIAERGIALTPVFDGEIWAASVEIRGESDHNRRRILRTVSATGPSPMAAVTRLIELLDELQMEK